MTNIRQPTQSLPVAYECKGILDLSKDRRALLWLNLLAFVLIVVFAWGFGWIAGRLRPDYVFLGLPRLVHDLGILEWILVVILVSIVMVVAHEGIHGLFYWLYLHTRPIFGLRGAYAYAAAPGWYIPRPQYTVIGLAPLVLISLIGTGLVAVLPLAWLTPLLLLLILNAAGSVGDMMIIAWIWRSPSSYLANDRGDAVALYGPVT